MTMDFSMKHVLSVAIAVILVGCAGSTEPPVPPTLAAGMYSLTTVNGHGLPLYTGPAASDSLRYSHITVNADQTFNEESLQGVYFGHATGTIVFRDDGWRFWLNGDSTQVLFSEGVVNGATLTMKYFGQTRVFQRSP